jgi:hypothetical protein
MSHGIQATCKPNQATKSSKTKIGIVVIAVGLIVAGCAVWQLLNSRVARSVVDQKGKEILKTACLLELTNSWRTVNASGGLVGSPFCSVRWHREYFLEKEAILQRLKNCRTNLDPGIQRLIFTSHLSDMAERL